jgi:hypothetical protein
MRQVFFFATFVVACIASADEPGAKPASREIPLSSIVTTSLQKGMKQTSDAFPYKDRASVSTNGHLQRILAGTKSGASNVFLVDAKDMHDAVGIGARVIVGAHQADTAARQDIPKPKHYEYWMIAYLGSGPSEPAWWTVESATVQGTTVRLNYLKSPPSPATKDLHPYYFWVPVGDLENGSYQLELFDVKNNVVTLSRRVTVEKEAVK